MHFLPIDKNAPAAPRFSSPFSPLRLPYAPSPSLHLLAPSSPPPRPLFAPLPALSHPPFLPPFLTLLMRSVGKRIPLRNPSFLFLDRKRTLTIRRTYAARALNAGYKKQQNNRNNNKMPHRKYNLMYLFEN